MSTPIDKPIQARKLAIIIINKKGKSCLIVDVAVPADHRVNIKEKEKRTDLGMEFKGI